MRSAETKARLAFVTLLLVGVSAALAWYFAVSSQYATYEIRTRDPVSGLIADAPVEFHGVEIGKVRRVALVDSHSIRIELKVRKDAPMTMATVATITARGLAARGFTGYVYVNLEDVGNDLRPMAIAPGSRYPQIPAAPSQSVNLGTAFSQVNENVQVMKDVLQTVLDKKTIASLRDSIHDLEGISTTLATNDRRLTTILVNTERASQQFSPLLQSSKDTVQVLARLNQLSTSLSGVATKINRDPSVLIRGVAMPALGPGESK